MKRKNQTYSREFKLEAIRMCEETDQPVAEVARQLGIHPNNLYKWRAQFVEDGEESFPGDRHAYKLRRPKNQSTWLLNAAAFLKHYGLEDLKARSFPATVEAGMVVVDLNRPA